MAEESPGSSKRVKERDMAEEAQVVVPGSERRAHPEAQILGDADRAEQARVIVRWSGDPQQWPALVDFAVRADLELMAVTGVDRFVTMTGTVAQLSNAFGTNLYTAQLPSGQHFRSRVAPGLPRAGILVPEALAGIIEAVHGLDTRPVARPYTHIGDRATAQGYSPKQVAALYGMPADCDGSGQSVYIVELGGGFASSDLEKAGIDPSRVQTVGPNAYSGGQGADGEVALDIQIPGAILPKAAIVVDFQPNQDDGFLRAFINGAAATPAPAAISCSWGAPEVDWTPQSMDSFNVVFQQAAAKGITIFCAAGDNDSGDGASGNNVDFPGSAPAAVSCGGTNLKGSGSNITAETVWNSGGGEGTGGGYSSYYPRPSWQGGTNPKRGVPDVAADADPATGWQIWLADQLIPIGGTSAVAPWMATVAAAVSQKTGKPFTSFCSQVYPLAGTNALRDITQGNNGAYKAGPGWDACTGNGSINVANLIGALQGSAPAPPVQNPPSQPPTTAPSLTQSAVDAEFVAMDAAVAAAEAKDPEDAAWYEAVGAGVDYARQYIDAGFARAHHAPRPPRPVKR